MVEGSEVKVKKLLNEKGEKVSMVLWLNKDGRKTTIALVVPTKK